MTFTAENYARLEWELSDDDDAPDGASDELVRMLVAHAKDLEKRLRDLSNAVTNQQDPERIEFIRRAAIEIWKSDRAANLLDRWAWARHEATLAWEAVREL